MSDKIALFVGIPAYGDTMTAHHARMWMEFGNILGGSPKFTLTGFSTVDVNPIDRARNTLLAQAMMTGLPNQDTTTQRDRSGWWLLMVDADTWVESADPSECAGVMLLRMIADADRLGAAVVCAPVVRRRGLATDKHEHMVYELDSVEMPTGAITKPWHGENFRPVNVANLPRRLCEIDACATAVMAINVQAAAESNSSFRFNGDLQLSEDLDFCRQIKEAGGTIFVDSRVRTGHKSRAFALYSDEG